MKTDQSETQKQFLGLYDAFHDEIFRFSLAKTRNRDLALDITQETFIKTWDYLRSGKTVLQTRAFLYRICRNLVIDQSRKKKFGSLDALLEAAISYEPEDPDSIPDGDRINKELFLSKLRQLDDHHFEILQLRFLQELTLSEIASIYKESENTVSVRIHRAVKQAKKLFADLDQEFYEA